MATTTYFGWETPDDTDLVKDGAAAIRTLGSAIDSSMSQLEGGTTGQILSKTSATDMAFTWIANDQGDITAVTAGTGISGGGTSGAVTVTNSMATAITTAGDLIKGTGSGTFDRLGIGTTGQILSVVSGAPAWTTAASATKSYSLVASGSLSGASTSVTGLSGYDNFMILVNEATSASAAVTLQITFNSDSGNNYFQSLVSLTSPTSYSTNSLSVGGTVSTGAVGVNYLGTTSSNTASTIYAGLQILGANSTGFKAFQGSGAASPQTGNAHKAFWQNGVYVGTSVISSIQFVCINGTWNAGNYRIYGAA